MESKSYFQSYANYFWEWEDGGEVLAIPNESTIAYRGFIVDALEKLASNGLPPFGSLLLAIIATNPGGSNSLDSIYSMLSCKLSDHVQATLTEAMPFLKLLTEMPDRYKQGNKRMLLLQVIFERCHNIHSAKASLNLYEDFLSIKNLHESHGGKKDFEEYVFLRDFRTIAMLSNKFWDVNSVIERIASLPDVPEELQLVDNDRPVVGAEKDFIDILIENHKTFHVGSLIKHIWGGLNIPVHSSLPSEQPIGGVSDLTNKGDFDKLLISEFANEDLVFLSRMANNEALYIRREVPPTQNNLRRIILIDVSLKNWGTPKTLAFAISLAIARHPKTNIPCSVFAVGDAVYPLSIENIDGIIDGLQILDGSLHSGQGLTEFFRANGTNNNQDLLLITERTTIKHPEMLRAITEHSNISYSIFTDAEGTIDVYKKQQNSKKHLQHLQIPLEKLWKKNAVQATKQHDISTQVPILLPNSVKNKKVFTTSDGEIFQITRDNVLLKLHDKGSIKKKGWELLLQNLSFLTCEFEIGLMNTGDHILLMFDRNSRIITLTNLATGAKAECAFDQWRQTSHPSFVFDSDCFHHKNAHGNWKISASGSITSVDDIPNRLFVERRKALSDISNKHSEGTTIFKNINRVFINQAGNLVFNVHELILKQNNHFKLEKTDFLQRECDSIREGENQFIFSDGSVVETNRAGVFILKSSNSAIPYIYVSSVINATVGMATDEEFAGNDYYNKSLTTISASGFCRKYLNEFIGQIQTGIKKR